MLASMSERAVLPSIRAAVLCAVALGLASLPANAGEDEPVRMPLTPAEIPAPTTIWYGFTFRGLRAGWMSESVERTGELVRWTQERHSELAYGGERRIADETTSIAFEANPPYAFAGGYVERSAGRDRRRLDLARDAAGVRVTSRDEDGKEWTTSFPLDLTLEDRTTPRRWVVGPRRVGDTLRYRWFDFSHLRLDVLTARVTDVGSRGGARWVDLKIEDPRGEQKVRYDVANGAVFQVSQGPNVYLRTTQEEAKTGAGAVDLMDVLALVKIDAPIGDASPSTRLVLETDGKASETIRDGARQRVTREESGRMRIALNSEGSELPATATEIAEALRPIDRYGAGSTEVARLAGEIVEGATTPIEKVTRLVAWAHEHMTYEMHAGDDPIETILRTKVGDCSETSILFTALARASGVPAREVDGLEYMGDRAVAFAAHRWNEVVIDGRWVPVDATGGQVPADLRRIALASGSPPDRDALGAVRGLELKLIERRPPP